MGGTINWRFPNVTVFFVQFWNWLVTNPILFIVICVCGFGAIKLLTTEGRSGWVSFVGAPVVYLIVVLLNTVFPAIGNGAI